MYMYIWDRHRITTLDILVQKEKKWDVQSSHCSTAILKSTQLHVRCS